MLVCESMTALAYPFVWPHVYVPLLPPSLENFLDAPVPYVMGLLRRAHDVELYQRGGVCIVDIDNGELDLPEELPNFPSESELKDEIESVILKVRSCIHFFTSMKVKNLIFISLICIKTILASCKTLFSVRRT